MYEKHFGLKSRPFRSSIESPGIFVGPAQAKIMANLKKSLAATDAIVTVTGPVGVGKSTVVNRALEGIGNKRIIARVGRMKLAADEVLELLLTELHVSRQPTGTIQRFAVFKRLLHEWADADTRAFIVVEDAERIGIDALLELEALTAADHGEGIGANIVLMGQPTLSDLLASPPLARMRQRVRLKQSVGPFSAAETLGYLKHCIRNAGGDFDRIFDPHAADMLYRCSEGLPRVINNLSESVLVAASEAKVPIVMPQLVQHIALEEFGLGPNLPATPQTRQDAKPADLAPAKAAGTGPGSASVGKGREPESTNVAASSTRVESANRTLDEFEPVPVAEFTTTPTVRPLKDGDAKREIATEKKNPETPVTAKPLESNRPAKANEAGGMAKPAAAMKPAETAKPAAAMKPAETAKPAAAMKPADTAKPAATTKPAAAMKPAETAKPAAAMKPADTAKPVATTKPAEGTQPAAAMKPAAARTTAAADKAPDAKPSATVTASPTETEEPIPELIQDTQPKLTALSVDDDLPDLTDLIVPLSQSAAPKDSTVAGSGSIAKTAPQKPQKSGIPPSLNDIPTLSGDMKIERRPASPAAKPSLTAPAKATSKIVPSPAAAAAPVETADDPKLNSTITEIPAWDRDPTLAELRPDIAALEEALARSSDPAPEVPAMKASLPPPVPPATEAEAERARKPFDLPEITLEKKLVDKEKQAQEALRKDKISDSADADAAAKARKGVDLDRIAAELRKARSLEDVDDRLAETLFGDEMAAAAAEIAAMVAADEAANQELAKTVEAEPVAEPVVEPVVEPVTELELEPEAEPIAQNETTPPPSVTSPKPPLPPETGRAPAKASQKPAASTPASAAEPAPVPIEDQFGTSMTASLKALSAAQIRNMDESANDEDEDDGDEPEEPVKAPRRLFGLFRGNS